MPKASTETITFHPSATMSQLPKAAPSRQEVAGVLALCKRGDLAILEPALLEMTTHFPQWGLGWKLLGAVLTQKADFDAALKAKEFAAQLLPQDSRAQSNLAAAYRFAGRHSEAEALYGKALVIDPFCGETHNDLGTVLQSQGNAEAAEQSYRRAAELRPELPEAHSNLGILLWHRGDMSGAEAAYRRALSLNPNLAQIHSNLGSLLSRLGQLHEAEVSCRRAIELDPTFAEAWNNLGDTLQAVGRNCEAAAAYRRTLKIRPDFPEAHSNLLFCLGHDASVAPKALFAEHLAFQRRFEAPLRTEWPRHRNSPDPDRPLRIGVISADLRDHAVAYYAEPLFAAFTRETGFALIAYDNNRLADPISTRIRSHFAEWNQVYNLRDAPLAAKIQADAIDVLIDLSGHTNGGRLLALARKPAPIQCGWIGYLGTSGLESMDYYFADRHFLPLDQTTDPLVSTSASQFTEKLLYLPAVAPFQPRQGAPPVNELPALSSGRLTLGSFSRLSKLSPEVIALWSQLLRALPDTHMVLGAIPRNGGSERIAPWFAAEGIPANRLTFLHAHFVHDYLAQHHRIDFCLDPFPFTGATTTLHAIWMGVPTLTLAGATPPGRLGQAMLLHVGLNAFVAHSSKDFLAKGLYWANHLDELSDLRRTMRVRFLASPPGHPEIIARAMADGLRQAWKDWCARHR